VLLSTEEKQILPKGTFAPPEGDVATWLKDSIGGMILRKRIHAYCCVFSSFNGMTATTMQGVRTWALIKVVQLARSTLDDFQDKRHEPRQHLKSAEKIQSDSEARG